MEVVLRGRRQGKTSELIRLAAEKYAYIVCADKQQAINLWQRVREMGLMGKVPFPLTWAEFAERRYGPGVESILIDDLDACLQAMTSCRSWPWASVPARPASARKRRARRSSR